MAQRSRILIVDDEPVNVKLLAAHLASQGYETVAAATGEEALRLASAGGLDLVLLDVMMPKLDGFEVTRRLRAQEPPRLVPIVLITTLKETADRIKGIEAGCDDFISKPFDKEEVLARVKTLLRLNYYRSLLDEKEKFESVIDHIEDGILVLDRQLRLVRANRRAIELLELDPTRSPEDFLAHVQRRFTLHLAGDLQTLLPAQALAFDLERPETPSAKALILAVRSAVVRDPTGAVSSVVLTLHDVTEQRREETLKQTFLGLMSHKLHTPLAVITSNASTLQEGLEGPLTEPQQEAADAIMKTAYQLSDLLDRLLEFAMFDPRAARLSREPVALATYLPGLLDTLVSHAAGGRRVEVQCECPDRDATVQMDPTHVDLILKHLVDNAIKFADKDPVRLAVQVSRHHDRVEWRVTDNGPGIPPEEQTRIFEGFYQVEKEFTGTVEGVGLGLALVKRLVTSYGGTIQVSSTVGEGSAFTITFPLDNGGEIDHDT